MKRGLQPFSRESSNILAKLNGLLPSMAEMFRTPHCWSSVLKHTVPFSSRGSTLASVDDDEEKGGRPLKPIPMSNKNVNLLPFPKDRNISSMTLGFPCMAETFRTHDWSLLLKYNVPCISMGDTPEFVDDVEKAGGGALKPISISDKDLQLPSFLMDWFFTFNKLKRFLPSVAETFETKDWSLLLKFSSLDSKLNIEDALKSDLVAICVCFLFTEVPPHVRESVARTLAFISLGISEARKMSTDQMVVENLVMRILSSGNTEVQRQVCLALSAIEFNCNTRFAYAFDAGIQDQLIQLICNLHCNPDLTYPVINAISGISPIAKVRREKVVKAELLNSWLVKLLSIKDDESIMKETCSTVACISFQRCDPELWDHLKQKLLPLMVDRLHNTTHDVFLVKPAALVLKNITKHGSSNQIDDVVEMGGIKCLLHLCSFEDESTAKTCLNAFKNILRAGEANAKAKTENKYAMMIDGYSPGWNILLDMLRMPYVLSTVNKIKTLVRKYRPVYEG